MIYTLPTIPKQLSNAEAVEACMLAKNKLHEAHEENKVQFICFALGELADRKEILPVTNDLLVYRVQQAIWPSATLSRWCVNSNLQAAADFEQSMTARDVFRNNMFETRIAFIDQLAKAYE